MIIFLLGYLMEKEHSLNDPKENLKVTNRGVFYDGAYLPSND
jgi:hypothetical protein